MSDETDLAIKLGGGVNFKSAGGTLAHGIEGVFYYVATEGSPIRFNEPTKILTLRANLLFMVGGRQ